MAFEEANGPNKCVQSKLLMYAGMEAEYYNGSLLNEPLKIYVICMKYECHAHYNSFSL